MFTGIIEETGKIQGIHLAGNSGEISIAGKVVLEGTRIGDSISVNGVCLTVTSLRDDGFTADIMPETVRRTGFQNCHPGDRVNLERAMPANGRFGGHIVAGHVDGLGRILSVQSNGNAVEITIQTDPDILRFIVEKGSIAIDGISLTVAAVGQTNFTVGIIPHTGEETTLLSKKTGEIVNLETDIIGKYVERLLQPYAPQKSGLTMEYLQEMGF